MLTKTNLQLPAICAIQPKIFHFGTPVIILPISYFVFKEKLGWQVVLGIVLAIAGVAVLFLA